MAYYEDGQRGAGPRKKSLLIGINYVGSQHALQGCHQDVENMTEFLSAMQYPSDRNSQVIMRDDGRTDPNGPFYPNGHNILAAMQWLISEPGTVNFLHYSGHGGQVPDDGGNRTTGLDDTIVPVDFERRGQIPSGVLHRTLVTALPPNSSLFIIFDCCHSGSAVELPYVYRSDEDGNVSMLDNLQTGIRLAGAAEHLIQGGFNLQNIGAAEQLFAGATDFFRGLTHKQAQTDQYGLGEQDFADEYRQEGARNVYMYSGCRDDQTSADASIAGSHVGAMSWAFLECMKRFGTQQSYIQVLQNTRQFLAGRYQQVPQLSVGYEQDLNYGIRI
ncbi:Metacaspase-1 [Acrodontium crateriforme]|uniref:Metacaspase-1 n=1 Tax=Acrodontium crateriforme TaxID=150365 RepID=A0AAQ3RA15_9PEZI|nr:Metacaspase-1 [Acrodontium crateriforme]